MCNAVLDGDTAMKRRCPAAVWTHQGYDSLRCDLKTRHLGRHAVDGAFAFQFDTDEVGAKDESLMKHFFNVFMWIILMMVPVIILLLTDALARFVETMYWPYRHWVERIFPTR